MTHPTLPGTQTVRARGAWLSSLAAITALLIFGQVGQAAAQGNIPDSAKPCLTCHAMPSLSKTMENGEKLALHVDKTAFAGSVHAMMGCSGCHRDVDPSAHPSGTSYDSVRAYSVAKNDTCKTCHSAMYQQYEDSIHASLVADGNDNAPVCSSCHDVHAQVKVAKQATQSGAVCQSCHEAIFEAYRTSMHGEARLGSEELGAPACSDCHSLHDVTAASAGERLQGACLGCHDNAAQAHSEWLPNSGLHLKSVACAACHSPDAERAVDLRLYDRKSRTLVGETKADPRFVEKAQELDVDGDGLDPLELWNLVRAANKEGIDTSLTLHGRLEVRGEDAHHLADKTEAIRDCDTCHQKGALAFENVTVSVTAEDGRRIRYDAAKNTLTSPVSLDSVGNFYTAGGTRITILDGLLALALMAGIGIPLTHFSIRKWFKSRS
jgi:hypothetical protein